ncbi:MAG: ATP-binding protein [Bacilli bacterium]
MKYMLAADKEHYQLKKDSIDALNIKCHDLKHTLNSLKGELSPNAISEFEKVIKNYDSVIRTGNDALDTILTEKNIFCQQNNISFTFMGDGSKLQFMDKVDIYTLFGNALDNASRAVLETVDQDKRHISMTISVQNSFISIHIENYYSGTLVFEKGLPVTTKEDKKNHGFGLKSIQLIVSKYDGTLAMNSQSGLFNLDIILNAE